jgi:dihydrofolate reductase
MKETHTMRRIIATINLSLDGVMQSPAAPDEDPRDGFPHGGWAVPYNDAVMMQAMGEGMAQEGDLLFGRRTYQQFFSVWPKRTNNPFTPVLNNTLKYVVSRTLREPLPWQNSALLTGDAAETVARLKAQPGKDIGILGSGDLLQTLIKHGLVDQYVLLIHPLLLGQGHRLFNDDNPRAALRLVKSVTTTTGVIIATYQSA